MVAGRVRPRSERPQESRRSMTTLLPLSIWSSIGAAFSAMMEPIYWAISGILVGFHWLYSRFLDPNAGVTWVLSIISLTIVIRTLMIPLFVKQINSSRKMQLLGPRLKELQEKYGADRERLGQETMKMYKEEGVNPAASCLPSSCRCPSSSACSGCYTVRQQTPPGTSSPLIRRCSNHSRRRSSWGRRSPEHSCRRRLRGHTVVALFLIIAMTSSASSRGFS